MVPGLRGAASVQKLLAHAINPEAYIFAIADADAAGERWFVRWCRRHRTDPAPLRAAAAHILSDRSRPKGRRPPIVWVRHWDKTYVPPDLLAALNDALHAFRTHPGA